MNCRLCKLKVFVILLLSFLFTVTVANLSAGKMLYSNNTLSAPRGLYIVALNQKMHYGDYVVVKLPIDVSALHASKGINLLKKVQGFAGDAYTVNTDSISIAGKSYPIYHKSGLPELELGEYVIPEGEMFFLNDADDSFDSRYLGSISSGNVVKKVSLLVPYQPFYDISERMGKLYESL